MPREHVQEFLSWFRENMPRLRDRPAGEVSEEVGTAILHMDGRLGVEVSEPFPDQDREIIFTAFSDPDAFPLVRQVVVLLPSTPGWKFIALKPPRGFEVTTRLGEHELNAKELMFCPIRDITNGVQLLVDRSLFNTLPPGQDAEELAWLIVETGVGEELSSKLKHIEFTSAESGKNWRPITELASYLAGQNERMADAPAKKTASPWTVAAFTYEDMPLMLRVRPTVDTAENRSTFPHLAVVTHELANVKSNGLPEDDYNRTLRQFDLDLQSAMSGADQGIVFLLETFCGKRNYYACVVDTSTLQDRLAPILSSNPQHSITLAVCEDQAWTFYDRYRQDFPW